MGIKRISIAILVVSSVLGLIILLMFQSGVDEKVVASILPKVEKRFGIKARFEKVEASLTSIDLLGLTLEDSASGCRLATAKRVKVSVRVGPLFWGKVDLTGIRTDGLDIRVGKEAGGCDPLTWRNILKRGTTSSTDTAKTGGAGSRPELQLSKTRVETNDGHTKVTIENINGRIGDGNDAVFETGDYRVNLGNSPVLRGENAEIRFTPDVEKLTVETDHPVFEAPTSRATIMRLARDIKMSIANWKSDSQTENVSEDAGRLSNTVITWNVTDGIGTLVTPETPNKQVLIKNISLKATKAAASTTVSAEGTLPGTDAKFQLHFQAKKGADPAISLKLPDVALSHFGHLISDSPHFDWSNASLDGDLQLIVKDNGAVLEVTGQTVLSSLSIGHERIADEPIKHFGFNTDFKMRLNTEENTLQLERLLISRNLSRFTLRGEINLSRLAFDLFLTIPATTCQHIREAIPDALVPRLKNTDFDGKISADIHLALDEESPESVVFEPTITNQCRITTFGDVPNPNYFRGPFTYVAYTKDLEPIRLVTGIGTDRWTPYREISPYLIETVLTTEDGKFWHHSGITAPEIRRAIELNLKKKSLSHGASTITMQLAKNLFLDRSRTVARKLQETVLVWYLESYFSKEELLELYFNIVEFGPSIYGIRDAAMHYFGREPSDLNLAESVYLIKLLPNPPKRYKSYERGNISERQRTVLQRVMKTMRDRNRLTDTELAAGLSQTITFHSQGAPLPVPRSHDAQHSNIATAEPPGMPAEDDAQ